MNPVDFHQLFSQKRFKRFHCHHFNDEEGCSHEFYEKHVLGSLKDLKPNFNPLERAIFYDIKRQYDIYSLGSVLHISRGILIKPKFYEFIKGYNLAEHCMFKGIKREYNGELHDDLIFLYFYRDYSLNIDYSSSVYWLLRSGFDIRDKNKESIENYVLEDNISFENFEDFDLKQSELYKADKSKHLRLKYLCCPEVVNYDMFGFQGFNAGIYVSNELRKGLEKQKFKGLAFRNNIYFKFLVN